MKFNPQKYVPLDYRTWILGEKAREGINIKRLNILKPEEVKLLEATVPFQDQRDDPGQGEMVAYFAINLLHYYPEAVREIAVPTAICHDIGWYGGDPEAWNKAVQKARKCGNLQSLDSGDVRKVHQDKGAEMALELFQKLGYPSERYHQECADIIRDHDTRLKQTTPSGKVVRDSDYLWRVTLPCVKIYSDGLSPEKLIKESEENALDKNPPFNLEKTSRQIGRLELANTIFYKFPNESEEVLRNEYSKEFEQIKRFYNYPNKT